MRILPIATLTTCTKIVKHTILVEVVVEVELGGSLGKDGWWVHSLRWSCVDSLSTHRVQEWLTSHAVKISVHGILKELGSQRLLTCSFERAGTDLATHVVRCEAHLALVDLVEALISLTGIRLLHVAGLSRPTIWTSGSLLSVSSDEA